MWAAVAASSGNMLFGQLLYVANSGERTISSYIYDQDNGGLSEILPRVATPGSPTSVAIHPNGKFAFVTTGGPPTLTGYSIDAATGALTQVGSSALVNGSNPQQVAIDPAGKFAVVAHPGAPNLSVFSIDAATGATTPVAGSPFATPPQPAAVAIHPNGFVYVGANGAPAQGTPSQIVALNLATGAAVAGSPFAGKNLVQGMAIDPAGKFLYVAERQDPGVLAFSIDSNTGALTAVPGSPFAIPNSFLTGISVDPAGKFLYVANGGGVINHYAIGANGALTFRSFAPSLIGTASAILDPKGRYLYAPSGATVPTLQSAGGIAAFSVDANTGALNRIAEFVPAGANPLRGAAVVLDPPVLAPISVSSVTNLLSRSPQGMPNAAVAQGSQIRIKGKNIGPAKPVSMSAPLGAELAGVSVAIQSGDATTACLMFFVAADEADCVVPSKTPLGDATLALTYKGRTTAPAVFSIVKTSVGLRALNSTGNGPAASWNVPPDIPIRLDESIIQVPNALFQSAKAGQAMVIQATGLGPVAADETAADLLQELDVPAEVIAGGKTATVMAKVRGGPGSDFILFKLPDDVPLGCYVPVAVRAGGVMSNVASISVSANGGSCSDAHGLAASDIDAAQKAGALNIGVVYLGHIGFGDEAVGRFVRYGANDLWRSFAPAAVNSGIRGAFAVPPMGSCTVTPGSPTVRTFDIPGDGTPAQRLNAGAMLSLAGPGGKFQLAAPDYEFSTDKTDAFGPGDYTVDNGAGTQAVGAFKGAMTIPAPVKWTNQDAITAVDRSQDLTVTWTGGVADKEFVMIAGLAQNEKATTAFLCTEKVSAGKFTVPAWVVSSLPASADVMDSGQALPGGLLIVATAPVTSVGRFTGAGLDFGVFTYEQGAFTLVPFK
ncbi:MAG: beta-propeller fold lactonase family protein [Bryobacteraceae bacterium]